MSKILNDAFYVRINANYTASVRCVESLVDFLENNPQEIGPEFGEITKESSDTGISAFYQEMLEVIGKYKGGFYTFNANKHQFVELTEKNETVSIKLGDGRHITVALIGSANCVDIQYTNENGKFLDGGLHPVPAFNLIGFGLGDTPVPKTEVTLATILL